jgi:hypothetical protein
MKKSLFGAAALLGLVVLGGCAKPTVVGKWSGSMQFGPMAAQTQLEFTADGKAKGTATTIMGATPLNGTYSTTGEKMKITIPLTGAAAQAAQKIGGSATISIDEPFKLDGDALTIGKSSFTRVKE